MGSVKNVIVQRQPTETQFGTGVFEFRSDCPVFGYGSLEDSIKRIRGFL